MRRLAVHVVFLSALIVPLIGFQAPRGPAPQPGSGFAPIDVIIDSGAVPLAAYQLAVSATAGDVRIVGIEGGAHAAFAEPPYYDPAAMQEERVIIAAFSTAGRSGLPSGRTRVATIHVHIRGAEAPAFAASLTVAATVDGDPIDADITLTRRDR